MDDSRPGIQEAWAILVETKGGGIEVFRGGITLMGARGVADEMIAKRPEIKQITVYPIEGGHAEGKASWLRNQDGAWLNVRTELMRED